MKKLLIILGVILSFNANAKVITTQSTGIAETYDEAVEKAVKNAVKQSTGGFVYGHSGAKLEANVFGKKLNAQVKDSGMDYEATVKSYKVIKTKEKNGKFYVTVDVKINQEEPKEELIYKSALEQNGVKPKLLVVDLKAKMATCLNQVVEGDFMAENFALYLDNYLVESNKFKVLDRSNLGKYAQELKIILAGLANKDETAKVSNLAVADYVLIPEVQEFSIIHPTTEIGILGETIHKPTEELSKISYKLVELATMEVVASGFVDYSAEIKEIADFKGCQNQSKNILKNSAFNLTNVLLSKLFNTSIEDKSLSKETAKVKQKDQTQPAPAKRQKVLLPFD